LGGEEFPLICKPVRVVSKEDRTVAGFPGRGEDTARKFQVVIAGDNITAGGGRRKEGNGGKHGIPVRSKRAIEVRCMKKNGKVAGTGTERGRINSGERGKYNP